MTTAQPRLGDTSVFGGEAHIEPHGVPGTAGRLAAPLHLRADADFADAAIWLPGNPVAQDVHAAFLASFTTTARHLRLRVQAAGSFRVWVDGIRQVTGPLRFAPAVPEFHEQQLTLTPGRHVLAIHAHADGVATRISAPVPAFVWATVHADDGAVALEWRCRQLHEFSPTGLRTSPLLGWMEWRDEPCEVAWWRGDQDGEHWTAPDPVPALGELLGPAVKSAVRLADWPVVHPVETGRGRFRHTYPGYRWDDPTVQFLLADLAPPASQDSDGLWVRYDLGRVRLGSLDLSIRSEREAEVTIAYAERLTPTGMVAPVAALSAGPTRMLQHFRIGPGLTHLQPLQALGARWVEVRIASRGAVDIHAAEFRQRDVLGEPRGSFTSSDPLLDRIWQVGLDTLRSSAEDSLVDSMRERAEWVGDAATALDLLRAGWGDYRLVHRTLLHAAAGARPDGLVAGCGPGELLYLGTYAAQWLTTAVALARAEGSADVLHQYVDVAEANMTALDALTRDADTDRLPWPFVDWGYRPAAGETDPAVLGHLVNAAHAWRDWIQLVGRPHLLHRWDGTRVRWEAALREQFATRPFEYHAASLTARAGAIRPGAVSEAVLAQLRQAFPFNPDGRRFRDITETDPSIATPYFTAYSMPVLLDAGLGTQVADLWRKGWGWMLDNGATTWWEVFDDRWSQCHHWGGAPTGQLSRYGLGIHPVLDVHGPAIRIEGNALGLAHAAGRVAVPGGWADVTWQANGHSLDYILELDTPIDLVRSGERHRLGPGTHEFRAIHTVGDRFTLAD